ncbi:unannotated protein [freshwater metagenome]|uniref:Unannotated protein n=1 Tax=freshwater metagenome TaxID=449393 RepID=A0A6J7XQA5_9ZZZZ
MDAQIHRRPLDEAAINASLSPYWRVSVVDLTGSTQSDLAKIPELHSGEVLATEYQSAGRGRLDRNFEATPMSALLFSMYVHINRPKESWGWLPLLAAQSLRESLSELDSRVEISLKWPNDLLIHDKKVAGLLCESHGQGVIIGVGLNVAMDTVELPVSTATSLMLQEFGELDRNKILVNFLHKFRKDLNKWDSEGSESFIDNYRQHSATLGLEVRVELPDGRILHSTAVDLSLTGELKLASGESVMAGDVIHLR